MKKGQGPRRRQATTGKKLASSSRLRRADKEALRKLDQLLEQRRKMEQLAATIPPEVSTQQLEYADSTILFRFFHEVWGPLGILRLRPVPPYMFPVGGTLADVEIFEGDPESDLHWDKKYALLTTLVAIHTCMFSREQLLLAPLPPLPQAREQCRLYLHFCQCQRLEDLRAFAATLTYEQCHQLLSALQRVRATASSESQAGLLTRSDTFLRIFQEFHGDAEESL